jgi:hypothetical protein
VKGGGPRRDLLAFAAAAVLACLIRTPLAAVPLERDEGEYAYIAQRWLLGEVPYKEAFDQKPPGVFIAYAVILRLIGASPAAIHWGAQLYTLGTLAVVYTLGRHLFSPAAAFAAALFAGFLTADLPVLGNAANTETFMILPMAGALLATFVAIDRDALRWSAVAGAASAAAILFKQVAAANLVCCVLLLAWRAGSAHGDRSEHAAADARATPRAARRVRHVAAFALGGAAAALPVLAYFAAAGAWSEFVDCVVAHNTRYASWLPIAYYPQFFWIAFGAILGSSWAIYGLAGVGAVAAWRAARGASAHAAAGAGAARRARRAARADAAPQQPLHGARSPRLARARADLVALLGWGAASFAGVATGGYFREHYFIQLVPAVALFAGSGVSAIAGRAASGRFERSLPYLVAVAAVVAGIAKSPSYYAPEDPIEKCVRIYGGNPFALSPTVGRFVAENTAPTDLVFVFGSEPQILFYAKRKSATRYIFVYPLLTTFADTRARQLGVLEELARTRPKLIVTIGVPTSFLSSPESTPGDLFEGVTKMVNEGYRVVAVAPFRRLGDDHWYWFTGDAAREAWDKQPPRTEVPYWCSLAVWERNDAAEGGGPTVAR